MDINTISSLVIEYGLNLFWAVVIFLIGRWAAKFLSNLVRKALGRADVSETLIKFVVNLSYVAVLIFAIIAALARLGVQTTSLVALLGAAGLAIGLALQGSLANFAAGVLILFFKPYKVGDRVEINGVTGDVESIQIFNTIVITADNKTAIIPNAQVTSGNIINYSAKGLIRLDMVFGIGYGDDLLKAKQILQEIITADERVAQDPAPTVAVLELGDNSVNFAVQPYVKISDYWGVLFNTTEQVKLRFDQEGISIPFPQRDVHLYQVVE